MKDSFTIKKSDVERLGKKVLKEVFYFYSQEDNCNLYDTPEEFKSYKEKFLNNLVLYGDKNNKSLKTDIVNGKLVIEILDNNLFEEDVKRLKAKVDNGSFGLEETYHTLINTEIDDEINGDLYYEKKTFKYLFYVMECCTSYLED